MYHCVLMSVSPYPTPPGKRRIGDDTLTLHVLQEAKAIANKCPGYYSLSQSFLQSHRAFYSTVKGVFAVYFVNVHPVGLRHSLPTFSHHRQRAHAVLKEATGHTLDFFM
jgi:hypothetical protein